MATKDVILKKKIGNVIYDLMVKTTAAMVQYDSSQTLSAYLTTLATTVANSAATLADLTGDDTSKNIAGMIAAAIAELEDATDPNSFESRIAANAAAISAINDATTGILATAEAYTDSGLGLAGTGYSTAKAYADYVGQTVSQALAAAFKFKGAVDYVSELPTSSSDPAPAEGDVYQVRYRGSSGTTPLNAEYAYDGTNWVELGSVIDLSAYHTATEELAVTKSNIAAALGITVAQLEAGTTSLTQIAAAITAEKDASTAGTLANSIKTVSDNLGTVPSSVGTTQTPDAVAYINAKSAKAQADAEATAASALSAAIENERDDTVSGTLAARIASVETDVAGVGRFLVQATQPADLTEKDLWAQIVNE